MENRIIYETKSFGVYDIDDYRDLKNFPIYVKLIKDRTATLWIDYNPGDDLTKIDSLTVFRRYLDNHEWANKKRHRDSIFRRLQSELYLSP